MYAQKDSHHGSSRRKSADALDAIEHRRENEHLGLLATRVGRRLGMDERELAQLQWAPRVNISARTGRSVQKLVPALETALESWDTRIPTGRLNIWIKEVVAAQPPPVRGGKQPRILFATQATARPPTFVLFTTGFLEAGYRRFLERRLRETFGFEGSPIRINVRVREKRGARSR